MVFIVLENLIVLCISTFRIEPHLNFPLFVLVYPIIFYDFVGDVMIDCHFLWNFTCILMLACFFK